MTNYRPREGNGCHDSDSRFQHQEVVLSCGKGTGLDLPIGGSGCCNGGSGSRWQPPALVVGTVNLDISGRHKPTVKIDFSSLINFGANSDGGEYFLGIIFQLSKISNSGAKIPLASWIFEKKVDKLDDNCACCCDPNGLAPVADPVQVNIRENFAFSWCDCDACPGCYTYILEVIDFESTFIDFASITNVSINAMAV